MKLHIVTIALDSMPFIAGHILEFNKLSFDWHWSICCGVAEPVADTAWVQRIPPRLSNDGTAEYLQALANSHPRVTVTFRPSWPGKTAMFNHMLEQIKEPGLLMQVDSDEIWRSHQLETLMMTFKSNERRNAAFFHCRFFFGPNIQVVSKNTYGNHDDYEWLRCWRFRPGMRFISHEPPRLDMGEELRPLNHAQTESLGLVFDHPAYQLESQVAFKEIYYRYFEATAAWRKLQKNTVWPVMARDWIPWIKDETVLDQIVKP